VGLDVVGDDGVVSPADVPADVRDALAGAAGHVVAAVRHALDHGGEVGLAVLGVFARVAVQDALDVAEAQAAGGHVGGDAAVRVVVVGVAGLLHGRCVGRIVVGFSVLVPRKDWNMIHRQTLTDFGTHKKINLGAIFLVAKFCQKIF